MKKIIMITVPTILVIVLICIVGIFLSKRVTDFSFAESGTAVFQYADNNIYESLSAEEIRLLQNIFSGKIMYRDSPACGFSEKIAIVFNGSQTLCFACDGCPIVYWKEQDMYFKLTEENQRSIMDILQKYGFYFPCV